MGYLIPVVLSALALAVLAVGLPFSRKFLRRGRYISGIILIALSFAIFWPIQVMFSEWSKQWQIYGVLAMLPFLISLFMFSSGIGLISKANNTPRDDYYDSLFS